MNRLILARHAETDLNVGDFLNGDSALDVRLTAVGREQARELGRLAGPVDLAAHTEFARTRETAELAWPGTPRIVVAELNEIRFGRFEGTRWAEGYGDWVRSSGPLEACPGGGESRAEAIRRHVHGLRRLLERPEATVGLVAHGAHVRYVLLALAGRSPEPVLERVPLASPFVVSRADLATAVELLDAWAREPAWT